MLHGRPHWKYTVVTLRCVWQRRVVSMAKIYPNNYIKKILALNPSTNDALAFHTLPQIGQNWVRPQIKAFQSHDDLTYRLIQDYKAYLFLWNTVVAKNNVSEARDLFLACVRQRTGVSVEKELFILCSAQCVNSDRQWRVVGLSVPVKSACVPTPCQVKLTSSKITILIWTFILHILKRNMKFWIFCSTKALCFP